MTNSEMILDIMKATTRGTYQTIDAIYDAMADDGRIDVGEGVRLGLVASQIALEFQPLVVDMIQNGLSLAEVSAGLKQVYQKLHAPDAPDVFGL